MAGGERTTDFEALLAEGDAVPLDGWDFSWFEGRATEQRPRWGYEGLAAERIAAVDSVVDLQTGGGEVFAGALARAQASSPAGRLPAAVWATEGWPPNLALARERLELFRGEVIGVAEDAPLPFASERFELVLSRHPAVVDWPGIARVLQPGGTSLSQQVAAGSNRGLYEYLLGPQPENEDDSRSLPHLVAGARAAGLRVVDAVQESTRVEFFDIAAVVHFLRKVLWTVPGFTVEGHRERLRDLHEHILKHGSFVCFSERALIEAHKPGTV